MSMRAVLVSVVILALLGVATFFALQRPPAPVAAVSTPLTDLAPSNVSYLSISGKGAEGYSFQFSRASETRWSVRWGRGEKPQVSAEWYTDSERVNSFLKLVTQSRGTVVDAPLQDGTVTLELSASEGTWTAVFDDRDLGGTVLARVSGPGGGAGGTVSRVVQAPADLVKLMSRAAVQTWISRATFPFGVADASRVKIVQAEYSVTLQRQGARWAIVEPVALPADQDEAGKLVAALGKLTFLELTEKPPATPLPGDSTGGGGPGLHGQRLRIEVSSEIRGLAGDQVTRTERVQSLTFGAGESPGSVRIAAGASVNESGEKASPVRGVNGTIDAAALESLSADPAAYASRTAAMLAKADMRRIAVEGGKVGERVYELAVEGWKPVGGAPPLRAAELVDWLADEKAERVLLGAPAAADLGTIRVGPDAAGSQTMGIGVVSGEVFAGMSVAPGSKVVVVRAGPRTLVYTSLKATRMVAAVFGEDAVK